MSTGSSKSRRRQRAPSETSAKTKGAYKAVPEPPSSDLSDRTWLISCITVLLVGAVLRLYHLDLVPLHHDEGVNGNFLVRLARDGAYQYDPQNYHGPSLYYVSAIIPWIIRFLFGVQAQNTYGLNTVTIRLVTAAFGIATIVLILTLRRRLGSIGVLAAAALLAVSPGAVYLSRYFIHESLFVFFTLGVVIAGLKYFEDGHLVYLVLASASAALLFATKETFIINAPVLLIALAMTQLYFWLRSRWLKPPRNQLKDRSGRSRSLGERLKENVERLGGPTRLGIFALVAVGVFAAVAVLFYSSFFTNYPKGVVDSLKTFQVWTKTGQSAHVHPRWKYVEWLALQESPLLLLGTFGAVIALWRPRNSFAVFSALWAGGTLAAYSLVPYKTPWLALNMILPLSIAAGCGFQALYEYGNRELRVVATILLLAMSVSLYQAIDLNFFNYDNDKKTVNLKVLDSPEQYYVYVYAHTRRETLNLVDEIDRLARVSGEGSKMGVTIVSPDYWPLPWYLRDYSRVGYFGHMAASTEPVVIASEAQRNEVQTAFGDRYQIVNSRLNPEGSYSLRPGVELLILVRRDIASRQ
ncbi:MAG TPA: flippase activity-associated protein Agl23 [Pyrinomonadaceae bacterium]|nr:flippase activity-associated protein Agl23 [Pyrinomonadaceae bacterium]